MIRALCAGRHLPVDCVIGLAVIASESLNYSPGAPKAYTAIRAIETPHKRTEPPLRLVPRRPGRALPNHGGLDRLTVSA